MPGKDYAPSGLPDGGPGHAVCDHPLVPLTPEAGRTGTQRVFHLGEAAMTTLLPAEYRFSPTVLRATIPSLRKPRHAQPSGGEGRARPSGLQGPRGARPWRHGHRLQGAAALPAAPRGGQGDRPQPGGRRGDRRTVPAGAGPGRPAEAPQPDRGVSGRTGRRLPVPRHGVRRGRQPGRVRRAVRPAAGGGSLRSHSAGSPGAAAPPRARPGPPRRQAVQPDADPRRAGEGARPGAGAGPSRAGRGGADHVARPVPGHPRLHGARAVCWTVTRSTSAPTSTAWAARCTSCWPGSRRSRAPATSRRSRR